MAKLIADVELLKIPISTHISKLYVKLLNSKPE